MIIKDFSMTILRQMEEGQQALFNYKSDQTANQIARACSRVGGKVSINKLMLVNKSLESQHVLMVTLITTPRPKVPHNKKVADND